MIYLAAIYLSININEEKLHLSIRGIAWMQTENSVAKEPLIKKADTAIQWQLLTLHLAISNLD